VKDEKRKVFLPAKKMNSENFEENSIRRYLLGELSEDEQTRVEDAAFDDANLLSLVESVENDLIDEYARGELSAVEKQNFERMFLTSIERKKKIEFARTLIQIEEKNPAFVKIETSAPESERKGFWQTLLALTFKPQIAFAAVVLLVLLGSMMIFLNTRKRETEIAEQTNANIAPQMTNQTTNDFNNRTVNNSSPSPDVSPNIEHSPAPEKSNQHRQANVPSAPKVSATPAKTQSTAPTFAALIFPLGMTRDGGGAKALQLNLAPTVKTARLVFNLEKGDEYKNYRIEIRNKSGASAFASNVSRSSQAVVINIPAARLAAGKYEAVLSGKSGSEFETIGYYDFEVVAP
jgi:hypothetical protein